MNRQILLLSLLMTISFSISANTQELFTTSTEDSIIGWSNVSESQAKLIVAQEEFTDQKIIKETSREINLPNKFRQFFQYKKIRIAAKGGDTFFIRPSSKYYLAPFNGAHTFRFWLLHKSKILFSASVDKFAILNTTHSGMHDFITSQCHGGFCFETNFVFFKGYYQAESCSTRSIADNQIVPGCKQ